MRPQIGNPCFSSHPINTGRQLEVDGVRGLAVIFMVLIHVQETLGSRAAQSSRLGTWIDFLGDIPSAPVFLFLLGIGVVYSRRATPASLFKRGILFLLGGYLLNVVRGVLPALVFRGATGHPFHGDPAWVQFGYVDIFQMAGMAFLLFALLARLRFRLGAVPLLVLAFGALNAALLRLPPLHGFWGGLAGLLWGANETSFFPFLSWIAYPLLGFVFGHVLIRTRRVEGLYGWITLLGGLLFALGYGLLDGLGVDVGINGGVDALYYHHGLAATAVFIPFVMMWMGLMHFLLGKAPCAVVQVLRRLSERVSEIYVVHWVVLMWLLIFRVDRPLDLGPMLVFASMLLLFSACVAGTCDLRKRMARGEPLGAEASPQGRGA